MTSRGRSWPLQLAILSVSPGKHRDVSPSMAGLLTNPAARAAATMPASQAEIEEKTKEKEKKNKPPVPIPWEHI